MLSLLRNDDSWGGDGLLGEPGAVVAAEIMAASAPPPELAGAAAVVTAATEKAKRAQALRSTLGEALERGRWLVWLMLLQSTSSWILGRYQTLLSENMIVISFLTMLVGAGGNAGAQSAVSSVRGIALGRPEFSSSSAVARQAVPLALMLSLALGMMAWLRVYVIYGGDSTAATAIAVSCCAIVFIAVVLGATLPFAIRSVGFDPAHAGATIQVIMDISGVAITCFVCIHLLPPPTPGSPTGDMATSALEAP